jgi:hypothetical protein
MPDGAKAQVLAALEGTGKQLAALMRARAPVLTHPVRGRVEGALRAAIGYKMFPKTLRMTVGIEGSKTVRGKLFYANILQWGRKAQTVTIKRGVRQGAAMHVSPIGPMYFIITRDDREVRNALTRNLQEFWPKALARVAEGGDYGD